jgi:hypothetical protein
MNPRQTVINPSVVGGRNRVGVIEAANGDIDFVCIPLGHECEWRAALRATEQLQ